MNSVWCNAVKQYLLSLQQALCADLAAMDDSASFVSDPWERSMLGNGVTNIMENGVVFQKAGVNFSHVSGTRLPPAALAAHSINLGENTSFEALGLSIVVHPHNPYVPTSHANIRFFMMDEKTWWFGGGYDLTPYYGFEEDCQHWHQTAKTACDPFGALIYPQLKKACDDYFYLKHRQEPRGIGGLFFDDWRCWDFDTCFAFMQSVGNSFAKAYLPIVERRKNTLFGEQEVFFQQMRRGRYVEFNLLQDRGTLFGIQSGGRTESILMSLPPEVRWRYEYQPEPGTPEARLLTDFLIAKDWV